MTAPSSVAPDLVIAGAARSGTSTLSATLATHPRIDAGSLKEPNYYSSRWEDGPDWYDALFSPRSSGRLRVDASVSYTYPQHPSALDRLRDDNGDVQIVYTVRQPLARLVSHYQLFRHYYDREDWGTLGQAIERSPMFLGAGDYEHWLTRLHDLFPVGNVLVVPFPATTLDAGRTAELLLRRLGISDEHSVLQSPAFRNEVRAFRVPGLRSLHRRVQMSQTYSHVRRVVGADRLRRVRQAVTRPVELPSMQQELASLTVAQRKLLDQHARDAADAVERWLHAQDKRLDMSWTTVWADHAARSSP